VESGGRILFSSSLIPETIRRPTDFIAHCAVIWQHIDAVLTAGRMSVGHIVKLTIYLIYPDQSTVNNQIGNAYLGQCRPALMVIVAHIPKSKWLLAIEAIAVTD
jgi:enamine deaminase RidA (YjgF/YER057c/UK114 family)